MEQEPVYVPSGRLRAVCESVLTCIYERRQHDQESYVLERVQQYNQAVYRTNQRRKYFKWLGVQPQPYITPHGMELMLQDEVRKTGGDHPVCKIHGMYGNLEHETKDAMIQCALNETVAVSPDMARGISHLGLPLDFLVKPKFGFQPR